MSDPLLTVLDQLDQWRHLPKYRLEQHVEVLFGLTLPAVLSAVLSARTGIPEDDLRVIPEFPIAYRLLPSRLRENAGDNQSFNWWPQTRGSAGNRENNQAASTICSKVSRPITLWLTRVVWMRRSET